MISQEDIEFHHTTNSGYLYAETNSFCFTLPEHGLMASVYTVSRKGTGVMAADVVVYGDLVDDRAKCLYIDSQQHLPVAEKLSDYRTASGLAVKAISPREYHVEYQGYDDLAFNFVFSGLMEPFDIHDPDHSPKAKPSASGSERNQHTGLGAGYAGHFDVTGQIIGELSIGGARLKIDCMETMDHSWGPRRELGIHSMGWMHAHFAPDLAFHWIVAFDPSADVRSQWTLAHGYVLDKGKVYGLTDLKMQTARAGRVLTSASLTLTDIRGNRYVLQGRSLVGAPWICYTSTETYTALLEWTLSDGRLGYGASQVNESMQSLTRPLGSRSFVRA